MLLAFLKLRLQRGELGEGRIGIRLPATLLRIDPLTRLAAIPILEIAPAFAARTIGAVRAVAVRALAAAALALLRASFGALLTILPIAPRLAIMAFGLCLLGRSGRRSLRRCRLRGVLRGLGGNLRARPSIGPRPALAFTARWTLPAFFGRTAGTPDLDHLGFGGLFLGLCFGGYFSRRGFGCRGLRRNGSNTLSNRRFRRSLDCS